MSEYQYYEFAALDRPLTRQEMAELREVSSRATITATGFQNEYEWGDLRADADELLETYFDAHLYYANWGAQTVAFRVPKTSVDVKSLRPWFNGDSAGMRQSGKHVILTISPHTDEPPDEWIDCALGDLVPLRAALLEGDLTFAYLAWLTSAVYDGFNDEDGEPPVPPALASPSAAVQAFAELMFIGKDLMAAVSEGAPAVVDDPGHVRDWVNGLSAKEKDRWLQRAVHDPHVPLGAEIKAAWRRAHPTQARSSRTAGELFERAEAIKRQRLEQQARERELAKQRAEAERKEHLLNLANEGDSAWARLNRSLQLGDYDSAAALAVDLAEVYAAKWGEFTARFSVIRTRYKKRSAFARRLPENLKAIGRNQK